MVMRTYNDIYIDAKKLLKAAAGEGTPEELNAAASAEARLLLAFAAEKTTSEFIRDIRLYAAPDYEKKAMALIERRAAGEPAAYITGGWEFYGLPMRVTPDVLIPRVDTEVVAEAAINAVKDMEKCRVLDLCTGSGCIGIAVAKNVENARVTLADISTAALKIARQNTLINKVSSRAVCIEADALAEPGPMLSGFDLIVSNPPYIPAGDIPGLDKSVRAFEPMGALDGGGDGLDFYRAIGEKWQRALNPGGRLVFECGIGQSGDVRAIGEAAGLKWLETVKDTIEVDRAVVFEK